MSKLVLCLCGPGGSGKSSLGKRLIEEVEGLSLSVSTTTREQRPGEVADKDYFFVSVEEFKAKIAAGDFLEHAEVAGNYYGTEKRALDASPKVLLDIDWQGAKNVKQLLPDDTVCVLILPGGADVLRERMQKRGRDSEEVISKRIEMAKKEVSELKKFCDYFVLNDDFEKALSELKSIITAECIRLERSALPRL